MTSISLVHACHNIAQAALVLLLQSGLILLLGLGLGRLLRRYGPQARSLTYRATLIAVAFTGLAALLLSPFVRPLWRITLPDTTETVVQQPSALPESIQSEEPPVALAAHNDSISPTIPAGAIVPTDNHIMPLPVIREAAPAPSALPLTGYLFVAAVSVWFLGFSGLLSWLSIGQFSLFRLRRRSVLLSTGTAADLLQSLCPAHPLPSITLLTSPQVRSPFLAGITRPAIFLPMSYAQDFTDEELRIVLAHEVAHWKHRDNFWVVFAQVSCAVLWLQPLLWVLVRWMAQAAEESCDIAAVAMGCSARSYAKCLVSLAERLLPTRMERSFGNGVAPFRSSLGRRIQTILNTPRHSPLPRWSRVVIALGVALSMVLGLRLVSGADASGAAVGVVKRSIKVEHPPLIKSHPITRQQFNESQAKFLAGLTPVQGPGVIVTLNDSKKHRPNSWHAKIFTGLIHDSDINQVVDELKAAGAEAIAVNDERLVATSPIRAAGTTILVNNIPQPPPYVVRAIGNPFILKSALQLPGGVADGLRRADPAMIRIQTAPSLTLPAYHGPTQDRYAHPVSAALSMTRAAPRIGGEYRLLVGLIQLRQKTVEKLNDQLASRETCHLILRTELQQALPQATPQQLTQAFNLETKIGFCLNSLQMVHQMEQWKTHQTPERHADDERIIKERQRQMGPLMAQEDLLFLNDSKSRQHLTRIHSLAAQYRERQLLVMATQSTLPLLDRTITSLELKK